ncbi:MAG: ferritin family protein [Polyangiaceae bacterium]
MTRGIDFSKLTLRDALDLSILVEEEAKDRYEELADQMTLHHNEEAARFFLRMVQIELTHEHSLSKRRRELFGDQPRTVTRAMIFDVEAPDYGEARATMNVRQAFGMALSGETKAYEFFDAALKHIDNSEVRDFFAHLRGEEQEHQRLVEAQIAKLPPEPVITAEDVSDEPVAH